mmetsp:Transcript_5650/g.12426  ORF Transcript_5650/g.12426 Transcript_5650/m.12426 type:complete len:218 (+) Transcript_5650:521-1174(+)
MNCRHGSALPVYFVYDSYRIASDEWAKVLSREGSHSIRGTAADGCFIALWLDPNDGPAISNGHFDGFYSYFASEGTSYASTTSNWKSMASFAEENGLLFIPSVGPGYDDSKIRPWNRAATKDREGGAYYRRMWKEALEAGATSVSITSFNEWGEGTQIEPAVPKVAAEGARLPPDVREALALKADGQYSDYSPGSPFLYAEITAEHIAQLGVQHQEL